MLWRYRVLLFFVTLVFNLRARLIVIGRQHLPSGGYILASNHISNWDPPVLGMAVKTREVRALGKKELFEIPILGRLSYFFRGIPVRRGEMDREALAMCKKVLQNGEPLMLMPEGTRSRTGGMIPAKPGVIFLAHMAKVPIVPAAIVGSDHMGWPWRRTTVYMIIGEPIHLPERKLSARDREEALDHLMHTIASMLPVQYRGVYSESQPAEAAAEAPDSAAA